MYVRSLAMAGSKRPRTERRIQARDARKLVRAKQTLARLEQGGAPEHPFVVETPAVIETRARAHPCPLCGGELRQQVQRAETVAGRRLRAVDAQCQTCGAPNTLWFRIEIALEN